jgi:hypothetical protein
LVISGSVPVLGDNSVIAASRRERRVAQVLKTAKGDSFAVFSVSLLSRKPSIDRFPSEANELSEPADTARDAPFVREALRVFARATGKTCDVVEVVRGGP